MKLGILGAGNIARKMAATVNEMEHVEAHAVASRDLQKAREFAQKWNVRKAYGSYEEMLGDPEIDLVYVCTPHSLHFEHMMMCLDKGKHVLCEKSFTMNADQARKVLAYGREKNCSSLKQFGQGICPCAWCSIRFWSGGSSESRMH